MTYLCKKRHSETAFTDELRDRIVAVQRRTVPSVPWHLEPEDLVQIGLERALRVLPRFDTDRGDLWEWLESHAAWAMQEHLRNEGPSRERELPLDVLRHESNDGVAAEAVGSVIASEALDDLTPEHTEVCLRRLDGQTWRQIAEGTGVSERTVGNRLAVIREALKAQLLSEDCIEG